MIWRNGEHYCDPTAGAALQSIAHKEVCSNMMEGKRFERDFKASVPPDAWCYRLRDSPISYYGGSEAEGIRFAQDNICDFFLFRAPSLYLLELKTVGTRSASLTSLFGRFDPDKGTYKKQKHLQDMADAAVRRSLQALVVLNYRLAEHTYALPAADVLDFVRQAIVGGRKSIPEDWCREHGRPVNARRLRVNWRYDVAAMMDECEGRNDHAEEPEI